MNNIPWPGFSSAKMCPPVFKSLTLSLDWRWPETSGSQKDCWVLRTSSHFHTCSTRRSGQRGESAAATPLEERSCVVKPGRGFKQEQPKVAREWQERQDIHPTPERNNVAPTAAMLPSVFFQWATLWISLFTTLARCKQCSFFVWAHPSYFKAYLLEILCIEMTSSFVCWKLWFSITSVWQVN